MLKHQFEGLVQAERAKDHKKLYKVSASCSHQLASRNQTLFVRFDSEFGFRETIHWLLLLHNELHTSKDKEKDSGKIIPDSHHRRVYWDKTSTVLKRQTVESLVHARQLSLKRGGAVTFMRIIIVDLLASNPGHSLNFCRLQFSVLPAINAGQGTVPLECNKFVSEPLLS